MNDKITREVLDVVLSEIRSLSDEQRCMTLAFVSFIVATFHEDPTLDLRMREIEERLKTILTSKEKEILNF